MTIDMKLQSTIERYQNNVLCREKAMDIAWLAFENFTSLHPVRISDLNGGVSSNNFLIEERSQNYVVRIEQFRNISDLKNEIQLATTAQKAGVPTPYPPVWFGEQSGCPVMIRNFLNGTTIDMSKNRKKIIFQDIGKYLAMIHRIQMPVGANFFYRWAFSESSIEDFIHYIEEHIDKFGNSNLSTLVRAAEHEICACIPMIKNCNLQTGVIHTDYKHNNILINQDDEIVILDWEKACTGPVVFDLSLSLFHFLCSCQDSNYYNVKNFFSGYNCIKNTPVNENKNLHRWISHAASAFFLTDSIIHLGYIDSISLSVPNKAHNEYFLKYCVPMYKKYTENKMTFQYLVK